MFQKKEFIVSEVMGMCQVEDITKLVNSKGNPSTYYVLKSIYDKKKTAYIPVENHQVILRNPMSTDEARQAMLKMDDNVKKNDNICGEIAYVLGITPDEVKKNYQSNH